MKKAKTESKKYVYKKCPVCGTKSRYDSATIYVNLPDGRTVGVPEARVYNCKSCGKLVMANDEKERVKKMVDGVMAEIDKELGKDE